MMEEGKIRELLGLVVKDYPDFRAKLIRTNPYVYSVRIVERSTGSVYTTDLFSVSVSETIVRSVFSEAFSRFKVKLKAEPRTPAKKPRCYDTKAYEKITTYGLF